MIIIYLYANSHFDTIEGPFRLSESGAKFLRSLSLPHPLSFGMKRSLRLRVILFIEPVYFPEVSTFHYILTGVLEKEGNGHGQDAR